MVESYSLIILLDIMYMDIIDQLQQVFVELNSTNTHLLEEIYTTDIKFEDPAHEVEGLDDLKKYIKNLYQKVTSCTFRFTKIERFSGGAVLEWNMLISHPKLNKGIIFIVSGVSVVRYRDKIYSHRDYFDLGDMLYERISLLGGVVRFIKKNLGK